MMSTAKKRITIVSGLILLVLFLGSCAKDPEKAKAKYLASGQSYMKKGNYSDAALEFRNALRLDPRFVDAYYQLAQADLAQHDWRAAYLSLDQAIAIDANRRNPHAWRRAYHSGTKLRSPAPPPVRVRPDAVRA